MKNLIRFFIVNPIWAHAILVSTILFGIVSVLTMDSSFFPIRDPTRIAVTIHYSGASPQEMEEGVTIKIENAIQGIQGVEEFYSYSFENNARIYVKIFESADIDKVLRDVENTVNSINSFPAGADKPIVVKSRSWANSRASFLSLSGEADLKVLKDRAIEIEQDLLRSDVISSVLRGGFPTQEFEIAIDEVQLLRYNLTFDDIATAFRYSNIDVSGGEIKTDKEEFVIRTRQKKNKVVDIEAIVLRTNNDGSKILIRDVADVKFRFSDSPFSSYIDGKRGVTLTVMRLENEDLKKITKEVEAYVEKFNKENKGMKLKIMFQFYDLLVQRVNTLVENGIMGLVLVLVLLGLFLNLRLSFWVAMGIPISFLGMFVLASLVGMTINMVSLFGMILVVGILVDDGIVIAENVYLHYEKGKPPLQAIVDGVTEVMPSVITSVLTTIAAFVTLLFIEGLERMYEMALSVIFALSFSLIEAFFILPGHLKFKKPIKMNQKSKKNIFQKARKKLDKFILFMRDDLYLVMLNMFIATKLRRRILFFFPLVFIVITYVLIGKNIVRSTFFPVIDFDFINIDVAFRPGETEKKTEKYLWYCYEKVKEVGKELENKYKKKLISNVTLSLGSTEIIDESGAHCGSLNINVDIDGLDISAREISARIRKKIKPDPLLEKFIVGADNNWGKPVEIAVSGKDYKELSDAKEFLKQELIRFGGLKEISDNSGIGKREIIFSLNEKAKHLGLTEREVAKQIRQGFFGEELQRLIVGKEEIKVWLRYSKLSKKSIENFEETRVKTAQGLFIPISELVNYKIERGIISIYRFNGEREIRVEASQIDANASTSEINKKISETIFPNMASKFPNIDLKLRGQAREAKKTENSMYYIIIILLVVLVLILSLNFGSFWQAMMFFPIIIIAPSCAIIGHGLEDKPVSLLSTYGIIALIGVLINDAVVYLDKFNLNLKDGMNFKEAILDTSKNRFRPILLTTITTCAGLYPLILEKNVQVQFLIPMAISVVYGILFGTFFILLFFPLLIWAFNDIKRFFTSLVKGKELSEEDVEPILILMKKKKEIKEISFEIKKN